MHPAAPSFAALPQEVAGWLISSHFDLFRRLLADNSAGWQKSAHSASESQVHMVQEPQQNTTVSGRYDLRLDFPAQPSATLHKTLLCARFRRVELKTRKRSMPETVPFVQIPPELW
jgi:hypothetical protein